MSLIIPRDYQDIAVSSIFSYFDRFTGNPVVAMPTGTGKSVVIALFIQRVLERWPNQKFMVLTHVKELIEQNAGKMQDVWPTAPIGIYSAGLNSRQTYMPITFGGVASVKNVLDLFPTPDLLLIDECHLLSPNSDTMYQFIIAELKKRNPYLKVIGFTATWWRMGSGSIVDGVLFNDFAINMTDMVSFNWFVDQGYLVPLIPKRTNTNVDVSDVGINGGDYAKGQLETATEKVTYGALKEAMELAYDRRSWLVFCAGNANAEHAAAMLNMFGVTATFVHDKVSAKDRRDRIAGFKDGYYRAICNNNVLTTGFDHPAMDCIIMLRKTMSPGLWVQMLGRGTRPLYHYSVSPTDLNTHQAARLWAIEASGKQNCLVLDFAGNTRDLGPINDPILPLAKKGGGGDAPVKICEDDKVVGGKGCGCYNHTSVRFCINCGAEFEFGVGFGMKAGDEALIRTDAPLFEWFDVRSIIMRKHIAGKSGLAMLKVTYQCPVQGYGSKFFDEYLGFEHGRFMAHKAHSWWRARHWSEPPATVDEVLRLKGELKTPIRVRVWTNKRYPEIMNYEYE